MSVGPPDLTAAQARFRGRVMNDKCQAKRIDTAHPADAGEEAFDESTGTYGPAEGTESASDVPIFGFPDPVDCSLLPAPTMRTASGAQDHPVYRGPNRLYDLWLPIDLPILREGDVVKMTASLRDPSMPGTFYRVDTALHTTFPIGRMVQVREITEGEPNYGRW